MKYKIGDIIKIVDENELTRLNDLSWQHYCQRFFNMTCEQYDNFMAQKEREGSAWMFRFPSPFIVLPRHADTIMRITDIGNTELDYDNVISAETVKGEYCRIRNAVICRFANEKEIIDFNKNNKKAKIQNVIDECSILSSNIQTVKKEFEHRVNNIKQLEQRLELITMKLKDLLETSERD